MLFAVGIVFIGVATVMLDNAVAYPGTAVLLPTLGTAALIAAGWGAQGWLASRGMVAIGQLSYSWYLWHWPLLALARANDLGERVPRARRLDRARLARARVADLPLRRTPDPRAAVSRFSRAPARRC